MSTPPYIPTRSECDAIDAAESCQHASCPTNLSGAADLARAADWQRDQIAELEAECSQLRAEVGRLTGVVNRRSLAVQQLAEWASTQPDAWRDPLAVFCRTLPGPCVCGAHRGSVVE